MSGKTLAAVLGAAALVGVCCSCEEKKVEIKETIRPVVTMVVGAAGADRERVFSGTARSAVQTPLSFRVGGEIMELPAKMGMAVKEGDLVARLDAKDYDLQVKQSEAQLAQMDALLQQAGANYERTRQLYETESVSKSELDGQEAGYKSALAQKQSTLKALEMARQQLDYCMLHAPVDGTLAEVSVEAHQTVSAGQTIAMLSAGDEMEISLGIPETLIGQINVGDSAAAAFDTLAGKKFTARVNEISVTPGDSRTYPAKLRIVEKDPQIRPGMMASVTFSFKAAGGAAAVTVPPVAVAPTPDGKRYVWVYDAKAGTVRKQIVTIGELTSDGLQILEGLKPGDVVVTRGVHRLEEGMKVRLQEEG